MHYNESANRSQAVTKEGIERWSIVYPKAHKGEKAVAKPLKEKPTYSKKNRYTSVHVGSLCRQRPQVSQTISIAVTKHSIAILLIVIFIKKLYRPIALRSVIVKMLPVTIIIAGP